MPHRNVNRIALARSPRGLARHRRRLLAQVNKRHVKRATFRDCGRRCVYCGTSLGLDNATLDLQASGYARTWNVLALGSSDATIDAVLQRESAEGETKTDLIILTHDTLEGRMNEALAKMQGLPTVLAPIVKLRKEELA